MFLFFIISIVLVFIDQLTKRLALKYLLNKNPMVIIKNIIEFVYVENRGAAFGVLQGKQTFFYVITIFILIFMTAFLIKLEFTKHNILMFIILCLIFSGAIGNFIDRVKNKYVVDFIYFKPIDFPVFNMADIYITVGCVLLLIGVLTIYKNE